MLCIQMCKSVQVCHRYLLDRPHFSGLDTIQSLYKISFGKFKKGQYHNVELFMSSSWLFDIQVIKMHLES